MIKCPFCHFDNEDGALFCERCTSDLTAVAPTAVPPPVPAAMPVAEALAVPATPLMAEAVPVEAVPLEVPEAVEAIPLEPISLESPFANLTAVPVEAVPVEPVANDLVEAEPIVAEAVPVEPVAPPPPPAPAPVPAAAPAAGGPFPSTSQPRLLVMRGQKRNVEYPIYEGLNFIGRADEKPVDIDLEEQEPPDRVWCSRQHACISWENDELLLEDLNSANGTYVNRVRVYPGQKQALVLNDVIQIGNVQLKVLA